MSKFPLSVELVLKKLSELLKIIKKYQRFIMISGAVVIAFVSLIGSYPAYYAQGYGDLSKKRNLESGFLSEDDNFFEIKNNNLTSRGSAVKIENSTNIFAVKENQFEKELYEMVENYPIREMIPYIAKKDKTVAAFIVGIAKKESNWGKRVPTKNGQDCYNYWGYKGAGKNGIAMGHGCFASPQEAVDVIGKRLEQLVNKDLTTPSKMVIWKCGSSCAAHNPEGVRKWISDVSLYFNKIVKMEA